MSHPSDETRAKISKSQRERYERERREEKHVHDMLIDFALWISPTWEADSEDDIESATRAVDQFLSGGER